MSQYNPPNTLSSLWQTTKQIGLVWQILIAIILGVTTGVMIPEIAKSTAILGELFVSALKAIAPILVFILVSSSIANQRMNSSSQLRPIILLYFIGTLSAAIIAVLISFMFPTTLTLVLPQATNTPPQGLSEVLSSLAIKVVDNPVNALLTSNFIGIIAWALGLGLTLRTANDSSKRLLKDLATSITQIVSGIVRFAPLGIYGLVANVIANFGFSILQEYSQLLLILIFSMFIVALVINPIIVFVITQKNPYPLILICLRDSGITAFFTRSSAANIPVNMTLCKKLNLNEDIYSLSIPLGATINMAGAAITITILTLATAHTLNTNIDITTAILLSIVASISACGASGVAGGSLLLIPLACSLFGIHNDIAMQVVAIGFIIGVIQDSAETALNSSTDVVFCAATSHHLSSGEGPLVKG